MWSIHCRIGQLASEWLWLCSSCLGDEMVPYMHIQGEHALQMTKACHPHTLGHLRNEVMECKHKEMKNLNTNQGAQRGCIGMDYQNTFDHDKMCLVNEMREQFFKLVMRSEGILQKQKQIKCVPPIIKNQLRLNMKSV
jgi:hypothetical protein